MKLPEHFFNYDTEVTPRTHNTPEMIRAFSPFPHITSIGCLQFQRTLPLLPRLTHSGIEIHYIYKGSYRWLVGDSLYRIKSGDAFITMPWETHGGLADMCEKGMYCWIIIAPARFGPTGTLSLGAWSALSGTEERKLGAAFQRVRRHALHHCDAIGGLVERIYTEARGRALGYRARVNACVDEILISAARGIRTDKTFAAAEPDAAVLQFRVLRGIICSHIDSPMTLQDIIVRSGLGRRTVCALISRFTGQTPHAYISKVRIETAYALMRKNIPLSEVALRCGFSSQQHFSNSFKALTGILPKDAVKSKEWGSASHLH
ncbi:MAG: AraC family transcriptional regulator [Spirochaetota bacterium]